MLDVTRVIMVALARESTRRQSHDQPTKENLVPNRQKKPSALPRYVERDHDGDDLSFHVDRGARIRLPNDPTTPEFRAAYLAALVDAIAAEDDSDDWSELQRHHELQRIKKMSDIERVERKLAVCAYLLNLDDPLVDPVVVPLFERLECDLAMLRTRDRALMSLEGDMT